jgi:hypothetical protein
MRTLLLDVNTWDLCLDARGNLAVAEDPYALAQDVASALRLFRGEAWFDTARGVPYFAQVLGKNPPLALMKKLFETAALSVPGVVEAVCFITGIKDRRVTGQVQVTDTAGRLQLVSI